MIRFNLGRKTRQFVAKPGWRIVGDRKIYFRSQMETKVAQHLQFLKEKELIKDWEHEPQTFWFLDIKRGVRSYLPDFKVHKNDGTHFWVEVKGYLDSKSKTKIKRFNKYYPKEELSIIKDMKFQPIDKNVFE